MTWPRWFPHVLAAAVALAALSLAARAVLELRSERYSYHPATAERAAIVFDRARGRACELIRGNAIACVNYPAVRVETFPYVVTRHSLSDRLERRAAERAAEVAAAEAGREPLTATELAAVRVRSELTRDGWVSFDLKNCSLRHIVEVTLEAPKPGMFGRLGSPRRHVIVLRSPLPPGDSLNNIRWEARSRYGDAGPWTLSAARAQRYSADNPFALSPLDRLEAMARSSPATGSCTDPTS